MSMHIGRSWPGMGNPIEAECPCPQEPCGLVDLAKVHPDCEHHPMVRGKTMRQGHPADQCPGSAGSVQRDPICPCCEMPIVDDYYRDDHGEEWHYECWNQPPVQKAGG